MRTEPPLAEAEHLLADREGCDATADRLDDSRELAPEDRRLRLGNPLKKRLTNGFADRKAKSVRFTVVACTLTSTS